MALRVLAIVTFILASMQFLETEASPVISTAQCTLTPRQRTDCGFPGISRGDCTSRGCCFDSSIPGVIWCYNVPEPAAAPEIQVQKAKAVDPVQVAIQEAQTLQGEEDC
ncbi:trefoil factor 3-like [Pseudophryne corroboree]|uniref:trefoil factor 3-like n=1 Tax=Pseudophryne corroboree TaxID=495146 RepID=UPI003081DB20